MPRQNNTRSSAPVQTRHRVIHEHDVRSIEGISPDGFNARWDNRHNFVLTMANQIGQRVSDSFLILGNQDTHVLFCRSFRATDQPDNALVPAVAVGFSPGTF